MTSRLPTRIDADGNTLGDSGVIVYNEDGSVNRSVFGRHLSRLEWQLCDALDRVNRRQQQLVLAADALRDDLMFRDHERVCNFYDDTRKALRKRYG